MKIMFVDDEPSLCSALEIILTEAGYDFFSAHDGVSGLALFDEVSPDLVILDVMIPKLDGFEICSRLRKNNASVPILMLSAKGDIVDKKIGFHAGADDYLTKPFNEEELLLRIEALLRRSSLVEAGNTSQASVKQIGDLIIDSHRCEVSIRGEAMPLTPKEFQIIEHMANHPGKVFTREDLIEGVWGEGYQSTSVSIPVYIRRIREKIEADPSEPRYLQTVWRFGYRLGD